MGYRYFDTFNKPVAYPFGYGLSYTTFSMSGFSAKADKQGVTVKVTVKNTGSRAGKQVAQVYVAAPKGGEEKPVKELKTFAKTRMLKPGESQTLTMSVPRRLLTSFDEAGSQWKGEAGDYTFMVGDNVEHILGKATVKLGAYTEKVGPQAAGQAQSAQKEITASPHVLLSLPVPLSFVRVTGGGLSFRQPVN